MPPSASFRTAVVLSGSGNVLHGGSALSVSGSNELFIPCTEQETVWRNSGDSALEILVCYPPSEER